MNEEVRIGTNVEEIRLEVKVDGQSVDLTSVAVLTIVNNNYIQGRIYRMNYNLYKLMWTTWQLDNLELIVYRNHE